MERTLSILCNLRNLLQRARDEIREYLLRWREEAPALILRYASEKLPKDKRVLKTK